MCERGELCQTREDKGKYGILGHFNERLWGFFLYNGRGRGDLFKSGQHKGHVRDQSSHVQGEYVDVFRVALGRDQR